MTNNLQEEMMMYHPQIECLFGAQFIQLNLWEWEIFRFPCNWNILIFLRIGWIYIVKAWQQYHGYMNHSIEYDYDVLQNNLPKG